MGARFLAPNAGRVTCRAVVTSGGRVDGAFAAATGTAVKALAPFGAGVLIDPVLAALRGCGIAEIAVVGGDDVATHLRDRNVRVVPAAPSGATNVLRALDAWTGGDLVFATSDLPFVDAPAVRAFLNASAGHALTMPLAGGAAYEATYPGAPPHVTALGGERIAGGSIFFIAERARVPVRGIAGAFFDARKSALGMARLLGPGLLLRFVLGRLQIADIERRASVALGVDALAVRDAAPALCYDIDTLADYAYACARQ